MNPDYMRICYPFFIWGSGEKIVRIEEREALSETLKGYTGSDCKFISLSLPHRLPALIQRTVGKRWVKTLLLRTQQALRDSGGGELSAVFVEVRKPLTSKGSEVHYHVLLRGRGLSNINEEKIIERWKKITGREVTVQKETQLTKVRVPDKSYFKNEEHIQTYKEVPHVEVLSEATKYIDSGTCDVRSAESYHARYVTSRKNIDNPDQLLFWGVAPRMRV